MPVGTNGFEFEGKKSLLERLLNSQGKNGHCQICMVWESGQAAVVMRRS